MIKKRNFVKIKYFILVFFIVFLSACGTGETKVAEKVNNVSYYGDSLVNHSGARLKNFLGIPVTNHGMDAQMTYHAITGVYGSIDWSKEGLYVFSWGTNEALQGVTEGAYKQDMNHVIVEAKSRGKLVVLEAPVRGQFINTLRDLSAMHNVPLSQYSPVSPSENHSDGVHLTDEGLNNRAKVLASVILKGFQK